MAEVVGGVKIEVGGGGEKREKVQVAESEDELKALSEAAGRLPVKREKESVVVKKGYLKKKQRKPRRRLGVVPLRGRKFKTKYVVLDTGLGCMFYAKTKGAYELGRSVAIRFIDIHEIKPLNDNFGIQFRVTLRKQAWKSHKGQEHFTFAAMDQETCLSWVAMLQDCSFVKTHMYSVSSKGMFPEQLRGVMNFTGLCFSGGGARAHTAALGQLRALRKLGLLNRKDVNYISSVSGSAWCTGIFTFYEKGAKSDKQLLGSRSKLAQLTMSGLAKTPPPLGRPATVEMWKLAERLFWSTSPHEWWERTVGRVYLEPFGLNDNLPFADLNLQNSAVVSNNSLFGGFHFAKEDRPFWIGNAAVLGPRWTRAGDVVPVQFTPMYSGTPFLHQLHAKESKRKSARYPSETVVVGGGMIDSFAFGSEAPLSGILNAQDVAGVVKDGVKAVAHVATDLVSNTFKFMEHIINESASPRNVQAGNKRQQLLETGRRAKPHADLEGVDVISVPFPEHPFTLRHALGISSHAPAFAFRNYAIASKLNPQSLYLTSPAKSGNTGPKKGPREREAGHFKPMVAESMDFADGGAIDNLGILALLQRRVKRIVAFVNSDVPVPMAPKSKDTPVKKVTHRSIRRSVHHPHDSREFVATHDSNHSSLEGEEVAQGSNSSAASDSFAGFADLDGFIFDDEYEEVVLEEAQSFMPCYKDWPQSQVLALFGVKVPMRKKGWGNFQHNKVFKTEKIVELLEGFQHQKLNGDPCIHVDTYEVLPNKWWNIPAGEVTIMWYYLEKTPKFEEQLPLDTKDEIELGLKGAFPRFPTYKTFGTRHDKWFDPSLTNEQVNLLSALTEWSLLQNEELVTKFLRSLQSESEENAKNLLHDLKESGFA